MFTALALAAALQTGEAAPRTITNADALRAYAQTLAKTPSSEARAVRFRLEFPIVPDRRTDIAALQSPAGWSYDARLGVLTLDIDLGAMTPQNYRQFDAQGLNAAPPLRTLFFATRATRDQIFHIVDDRRGGTEAAQGWRVVTESYGLAVPTSAQAHGVSGGDLPDGFAPPMTISFHVPQSALPRVVGALRLRVEGELRSVQGHGLLCGNDRGDGYSVDEFTQLTPNVLQTRQCFLPAVLQRIALVTTTGGPPLQSWVRGARPPTPETAETQVLRAGTRDRALAPGAPDATASSPYATPALPERPPR